jgi:hypothetical protein
VTSPSAAGADTDIRVDIAAKQAISRVHMVLRTDTTQWLAIDKSRNGIYVDGKRASTVSIDDDVRITLGAPDGPPLTFRITPQKRPRCNTAATVDISRQPLQPNTLETAGWAEPLA